MDDRNRRRFRSGLKAFLIDPAPERVSDNNSFTLQTSLELI
jgi:hypothetical protein